MREEDSNLHPVIPDQALNLVCAIVARSISHSRAKKRRAPGTDETYETRRTFSAAFSAGPARGRLRAAQPRRPPARSVHGSQTPTRGSTRHGRTPGAPPPTRHGKTDQEVIVPNCEAGDR